MYMCVIRKKSNCQTKIYTRISSIYFNGLVCKEFVVVVVYDQLIDLITFTRSYASFFPVWNLRLIWCNGELTVVDVGTPVINWNTVDSGKEFCFLWPLMPWDC